MTRLRSGHRKNSSHAYTCNVAWAVKRICFAQILSLLKIIRREKMFKYTQLTNLFKYAYVIKSIKYPFQ